MSDIHIEHENDEQGVQHTYRVVTLTDAIGEQYEHRFEVTDDGLEYCGESEPPESAAHALEEAGCRES